MQAQTAIRGDVLTFISDPFTQPLETSYKFLKDAMIIMENGKIISVDAFSEEKVKGLNVDHYPDTIICPGFIDCHVHYPQTQMIGAFGEHLLNWLNEYTFVTEQQFADKQHAAEVAHIFLRELLRAGTTTAAVYCTVHPQSVDAFFEESQRFNTRMIAGKVLMDRNAPEALLDSAETGYKESLKLLKKWHQTGRQLYCITPRFAPTSSREQLEAAGKLWQEHPGTYMQTHLCETLDEIAWVKELFPERKSYLDVYDYYGLTGKRAIFGHAIHMQEEDFVCCHNTGSTLAHCPTSNLFLGSGLFRIFDAKKKERPIRVGIGTDLGAGTSFSQLQTLNEAYKVSELNQTKLTALHSFYLATRGGAEALYLEDTIGSIASGYEADITILDLAATPLLAYRMKYAKNILEKLFVLLTLGDDRSVRSVYVAGQRVYDRDRMPNKFIYSAE